MPTNIENPKEIIKDIFSNLSVPNKKINITSTVLVYNIEYIIKIHDKIKRTIIKKKKLLRNKLTLESEQI